MMKQVHKSFGWSCWSSVLSGSPCHQFWYYFSLTSLAASDQQIVAFFYLSGWLSWVDPHTTLSVAASRGGGMGHPPSSEALPPPPPLVPPTEGKNWLKSAIFGNFLNFAPSDIHFAPSMPPTKNFPVPPLNSLLVIWYFQLTSSAFLSIRV